MNDRSSTLNALTIDVEDWYQGIEIEPERWGKFDRRLEHSLNKVLQLLDEFGVLATFFVLGEVAAGSPQLVRLISRQGHEIGTHGWSHRLVYRQPPRQFKAELADSISILQDLTGQRVVGHRAAFFSVTRESLWALPILLEHGIRYDSSVFPIHNYRYGIPGAPRHPYPVRADGSTLLEFPISTLSVSTSRLPLTGGFYLRFFPCRLIEWGIRQINREGWPAMVYLHPWELDPGHPRIQLPRRIAVPHYHNLRSTEPKLRRLLSAFPFAPVGQVISKLNLTGQPVWELDNLPSRKPDYAILA